MTFPRVHHADYFSDSGPVDGTVLVNSHSDAIEALQAVVSYLGPVSGLPATGAQGQFAILTDLPGPTFHYELIVWDASTGDWQNVSAIDAQARPVVNTFATITGSSGTVVGQLGFATDQADKAYVWTGSAWVEVVAKDSTARSDAATASASAATANTNAATALAGMYAVQPGVAAGNPTVAGAPTDGSVFYYFDSSTSPYTEWVFDGVAFQQVGGGSGAAFVGPHWFPGL